MRRAKDQVDLNHESRGLRVAEGGVGGIDRPLQYRRAMTGDEAFYLGSVFSRLVIRDDGRSTGSSTERYLDSVRPTDAPRRLPKIVEEEDVTPSREVESLGRFRGQGLDPYSANLHPEVRKHLCLHPKSL